MSSCGSISTKSSSTLAFWKTICSKLFLFDSWVGFAKVMPNPPITPSTISNRCHNSHCRFHCDFPITFNPYRSIYFFKTLATITTTHMSHLKFHFLFLHMVSKTTTTPSFTPPHAPPLFRKPPSPFFSQTTITILL